MPKRARAKTRSDAFPLDSPEPRRRTAPAALLAASTTEAKAERSLALEGRVRLSGSYAAALEAGITIEEADDPDALRGVMLRDLKARRGGQKLRVADLLAVAMCQRVASLATKDGVMAARELADRTEGPVVQATASASVSYVISVTPRGTLGSGSMPPSTPEQWEALARSDWDAAQALPPTQEEAQVRFAQASTGVRR